MKAEELLRLYRQGERNFTGENLRGQSFQGQDLSGADFSGVDIRSTNFSKATLIEANFYRAEAGLQRRWVVILTLLSFLLAAVTSFLAILNGLVIVHNFNSGQVNIVVTWIFLFTEITLFSILLNRGFTDPFAFAFVFAIAYVFFAITYIFALSDAFLLAASLHFVFAFAVAGAFTGAYVFAVAGAFTEACVFAVAYAVASVFAFPLDGVFSEFFAAGAIGAVGILFGAHIGWRALKGDPKYALIRSTAIALAACGGTSFLGANLTNASFIQAHLKSVDLRQANLTRTVWRQAHLLDRVRPGVSFLNKPQIRTLLQTGYGQGIDLTHCNLRGINLADAQLEDACFRAADLSEATLVGANLTRANLVQTHLDQTDLARATLTGATIQDWGITRNTNLQEVRCDYIYMRWVKEGDPDPNPRRKPDNYEKNFADGEFGDFIKPIFDTLDLYHSQNVDPRAIAIAFKQLAENNPEANLEIVAMEKRGRDKFLLRARTTKQADQAQLTQQYFSDYNQIRTLSKTEIQHLSLVAEKDDRILSLENFVNTALELPNFYAENYQQRGDLMSKNSGININARVENVSGIAGGDISGVINLSEIQGDIQNAIQQLPDADRNPKLIRSSILECQNPRAVLS